MTDLIDVVQKQDPGSELVELFELTLSSGTTLYFHSDFDADNTTINEEGYIYFRERTSPYTVQSYIPFPIQMDGVEFSSDGAQNRPNLTVANVTSTFSDELGSSFKNEDLIGQSITKRTTLKKYLYEPGGVAGAYDSTTPPIEFPIQKYLIDRVASENSISVNFELAAPFDLSGVKLPNRSILGKYCSWEYQGNDLNSRGGCIWSKNSLTAIGKSSTDKEDHKAYFTAKDEPIVAAEIFTTTTAWATSTSYAIGDLVLDSGKVYMANTAHTSGGTFAGDSANWDVVGDTAWATTTAYAVNDYVKNGSDYYRCNTAHTSSSTFDADSSNWDTVFIYTSYNSGTTYAAGDFVEYTTSGMTTVWKALRSATGVTPAENVYWTRGDVCGKKFSSCKCRFQYTARYNYTNSNSTPKTNKDTSIPIPYGAFPGARKFR